MIAMAGSEAGGLSAGGVTQPASASMSVNMNARANAGLLESPNAVTGQRADVASHENRLKYVLRMIRVFFVIE